MLYAFGFERTGVLVSDLYFVDPHPGRGQEGAERGVRLEVRELDRDPLKGSIYSAQPITVGRPIWRADLLEAVDGPIGTFDRTHHHPTFNDYEPSRRVFVEELSTAPLDWVAAHLAGLDVPDAPELTAAIPEIIAAVRSLLARIAAGELGRAPDGEPLTNARIGWL
jgi:hypothetical protein